MVVDDDGVTVLKLTAKCPKCGDRTNLQRSWARLMQLLDAAEAAGLRRHRVALQD